MTEIPDVLTTKEAAEALRVNRSTIRRWLKNGKLEGGEGRVTKRSVLKVLGVEDANWWEDQTLRLRVRTLITDADRGDITVPDATDAILEAVRTASAWVLTKEPTDAT
jgi:hypothetical protein